MIWLLQIPPLIVGTLTVVFFVAISLLGLFIFRRLVSQTRLENAHSVSGEVFFSLAGVLYAVLVAFVVVVVWEQFGDAERVLVSLPTMSASTFRFDTGVLGIRIRNEIGWISLLPFQGQQIWDAEFHGRRLTMGSMFPEPFATEAGTLSGGNQQKIVLAKWLSMKPSIIILDEPTRGIDVGAKSEIYQLMRNLADSGVAVLMISSDMEEVIGVSDRMAVMHEGSISGFLERAQFSEHNVLLLAVGKHLD